MKHYPMLTVNTAAMTRNAQRVCHVWAEQGVQVAGVVKFSDCAPEIVRAYAAGGCAQIAVSRAVHLPQIKHAAPGAKTLLLRPPVRYEMELAAQYGDLILMTEADGLKALSQAGLQTGCKPGVILMLDVGDLREGVDNIPALVELAQLAESLPGIRLAGVGTNHACLNGVLPSWDNLSFLCEGAEAVEAAIGRTLEIILGGSSINMLLLGSGMPERVNHLRVGGFIANPMNMRLGRGFVLEGMEENTVTLTAEVVDLQEKASMPKGSSGKNWAGEAIVREDKGRRLRAILALGSQDVGDASGLIPVEPGIEIVGNSSDHTILDVTDTGRTWHTGDTVTFKLRYSPMLRAFSGMHVNREYTEE